MCVYGTGVIFQVLLLLVLIFFVGFTASKTDSRRLREFARGIVFGIVIIIIFLSVSALLIGLVRLKCLLQ